MKSAEIRDIAVKDLQERIEAELQCQREQAQRVCDDGAGFAHPFRRLVLR